MRPLVADLPRICGVQTAAMAVSDAEASRLRAFLARRGRGETKTAFAERAGITIRTLLRWRKRGGIPETAFQDAIASLDESESTFDVATPPPPSPRREIGPAGAPPMSHIRDLFLQHLHTLTDGQVRELLAYTVIHFGAQGHAAPPDRLHRPGRKRPPG